MDKQVRFYKGIVVHGLYNFLKTEGRGMTKKAIDEEIKENAGFVGSVRDASKEELENLIIWALIYADSQGFYIPDLPNELDDKLQFSDEWKEN